MSETTAPAPKTSRLTHNLILFLPAVVLFAVLMSTTLWRLGRIPQAGQPADQFPVNPAIEERFGVRFTGLYVVAAGGIIDLRYRVVDVGKAKNFGHYTETSPLLIAEDSSKRVEVAIMGLHNHRVEAGRSYYALYRNTSNAIQPGSKVTIQVGDLRLEHIVAR